MLEPACRAVFLEVETMGLNPPFSAFLFCFSFCFLFCFLFWVGKVRGWLACSVVGRRIGIG